MKNKNSSYVVYGVVYGVYLVLEFLHGSFFGIIKYPTDYKTIIDLMT